SIRIDKEHIKKITKKKKIKDTNKKIKGTIKQIAPMYSAVRVKAKRLYEYARENIEVERPEREINIHSIDLLNVNEEMNSIDIEVSCSKGTYIRMLCVDIGKQIGYFAHMSELKRIDSDSFKASETFTFSDIESIINSNEANKMIQPPSRALNHLETYSLDEN